MAPKTSLFRSVGSVLAALGLTLALLGCSDSDEPASTSSTASETTGADDAVDVLPAQLVGDEVVRDTALFGFNGASIVQTVNVDLLLGDQLQQLVADFPTRLIRVPTGTAAQWIDWRTGRFIDHPESLFAEIPDDRRPVTMEDWANLVEASGATPVWDLNVLNATLEDQLEMLDEAVRLGMSVDYIELGNELWDVRSIYTDVYPTGTDYAETMNTWIPPIRERFPDAQIAVSGADPSDEFFVQVFGDRFVTWNDEVLATIEGADAIAIHPYWTLPDRVDPGSDVDATLTIGLESFTDFAETTLSAIDGDMQVWLTEWNQAAWASGEGTQIWAQALSVSAVALQHLVTDQITMSLVHNIVDGVRNPHDAGISTTFPMFTNGAGESEVLARTGLGHALPLIFGAVEPGTTAQALEVADTPMNGSVAGVVAVELGGPSPGAIFVNLTDEALTTLLSDDLGGNRGGVWQVTTLSAPADAEPGWKPGSEPKRTVEEATAQITLPAYSIVRVHRDR